MLLSSLAAIDFAGAAISRQYTTHYNPTDIAIADFDCDGHKDLAIQRIIHIELQFSGMMDLEILQKEQMFGYLIHLEGTQIGQISHLQIKLKLKIMQMDLQISLSGKLIYHLINLHNQVM